MKEIPLTHGKVALVDDVDYERLNQFKWCANKVRRYWYARSRACGDELGTELMHRVILRTPEGMETDHKNGDGLDNRRENIRVCTVAQNQHNQIVKRQNTTSIFKGVYWRKDTQNWKAQIAVNCRKISLGHFISEIQAAFAYDMAATKYFGEFARTNL